MKTSDRVVFSPGEFAALFGKSQTWGYRQLYSQKVKAIDDHGRLMIPASEVERILGKAGMYNGLPIKVTKKGRSLDPWRQFLVNRRNAKINKPADRSKEASKHFAPHSKASRESARARLLKKRTAG